MWSLRTSALISLTLHVLLAVAALWHPWPRGRKNPLPLPPRVVMVDFVKIGPKSGAPVLGPPGQRGKPSAPKKTLNKKSDAPRAQTVRPKASTRPSQDSKKTTKTPSPKERAKPLPHKADLKKPVPKKEVKPVQKPAAKKSTKTPAKMVKQGVEKAKVNLAPAKPPAATMGDLLGALPQGGSAGGAMAETYADELTGTEMDLLNRHMKRFWNMPSGHEKAYDLVVEVELFIRPDGTIEKAQLVDEERAQKDPEFRLAAECALRAVLDPECSPLPLPAERYETWKHMIFVFDPREMCR